MIEYELFLKQKYQMNAMLFWYLKVSAYVKKHTLRYKLFISKYRFV